MPLLSNDEVMHALESGDDETVIGTFETTDRDFKLEPIPRSDGRDCCMVR